MQPINLILLSLKKPEITSLPPSFPFALGGTPSRCTQRDITQRTKFSHQPSICIFRSAKSQGLPWISASPQAAPSRPLFSALSLLSRQKERGREGEQKACMRQERSPADQAAGWGRWRADWTTGARPYRGGGSSLKRWKGRSMRDATTSCLRRTSALRAVYTSAWEPVPQSWQHRPGRQRKGRFSGH